jgi:hypothetical protein
VPLLDRQPKRQAGTLEGLVELPDSFVDPLPANWTGEA